MITFSLITVCYNAADTIGRTLDSVRQQRWQHIQHIIIDGASTDGTTALLEAYRKQAVETRSPHQINIVSEPDNGIYDAMNKGLALAEGRYVCFLNAGDALPDTDTIYNIGTRVGTWEADEPPSVIYGDTDIINTEGQVVAHRHLNAPDILDSRSFRKGMTVCHQAFYARTDIAKDTPYDLRYRYSADVDWCIRVLKAGERCYADTLNMHAVIAHYLQEGTTTRNHRASLKERFHIMRRHYGLATTLYRHVLFLFRAAKRKTIK